jgi:hypothetical protein
MVVEEKEEITFIDELYIIVDGTEVHVETSSFAAQVAEKDQDYLVIASGESREFRFKLPDSFAGRQLATVSVVVSGFYLPLLDLCPAASACRLGQALWLDAW